MTLILFLCRGNTCRSPMAEIVARDAAQRAGLSPAIAFGSAGVAIASTGAPADPRALACVAQRGLDLSAHRTRGIDSALLARAGRIYALDRSVERELHTLAPRVPVKLLMDLVPHLGLADVADPWHGTAVDYAAAFDLIQAAVTALIARLGRDDA